MVVIPTDRPAGTDRARRVDAGIVEKAESDQAWRILEPPAIGGIGINRGVAVYPQIGRWRGGDGDDRAWCRREAARMPPANQPAARRAEP